MFSHDSDPAAVAGFFDNGATSFPKPTVVWRAMEEFAREVGGTYGRAAHSHALRGSRVVFETRRKLSAFLGIQDSSRLAFTFNATHGLNTALRSLAEPGAKVLVSPLEHNAVMRPLDALRRERDIRIEVLPHRSEDGRVDPSRIEVTDDVALVVVNMVSNVNGVVQPVHEIKGAIGAVPLVVDAAQAAGDVALAVGDLDVVAFTGHKHLLGPTGTGALYVRPGLELEPLMPGGTGSRSESVEQPPFMPDRLEGGTPNTMGIVGLGAALDLLLEGLDHRLGKSVFDMAQELETIPRIRVYRASRVEHQGGLFSFNLEGMASSTVARELDERFGIAVRPGLHCAPWAHRHLGTLESNGTVRAAPGLFHTREDLDRFTLAVKTLAKEG